MKKVIITVGGTGGHIYPAMTLAQQLKHDVLFVGGNLTKNQYFKETLFPFREVSCGSLNRWWRIVKGYMQSRRILKEYKPDVVFGFGSYYTLPTLLAAKSCSIPVILHEQNILPGRVTRLLSPYVRMTALNFRETAAHLKGKTVEVKLLIKEHKITSKEDAREYFGLEPHIKTLLIFGGSQGAQAINRVVSKVIPNNIQVLHFTGDHTENVQYRVKACVKPFESRMDLAWQAADLALSRAGAGTITESIKYEVPTILVPYPGAMDNHQEKNADFMVNTVGGAIKVLQSDLNEKLAGAMETCLDQRESMRQSIQTYKQQRKSQDIRELI